MKKRSKRYKLIEKKKVKEKLNISKSLDLIKDTCTSKMDESIDLSIKINTKQSKGGDFNLRTIVKLPHGNGKKFKIIKIPMPSPIFIQKTRVPASYLNFFISNKTVLVPIFNVKEDKKVLKIFRKFFTKRKVIAVDCSDLIWGFGAIHCMTQQEPII